MKYLLKLIPKLKFNTNKNKKTNHRKVHYVPHTMFI